MARPKERVCKRGHDTWTTGRDKHGWCSECRRIATRKPRRLPRPRPRPRVSRWVPAAPLVAILNRSLETATRTELGSAYAGRYGGEQSSAEDNLRRTLRAERITVSTADRWLTLLGKNFSAVYSERVRGAAC